jgi:hypothetical protein
LNKGSQSGDVYNDENKCFTEKEKNEIVNGTCSDGYEGVLKIVCEGTDKSDLFGSCPCDVRFPDNEKNCGREGDLNSFFFFYFFFYYFFFFIFLLLLLLLLLLLFIYLFLVCYYDACVDRCMSDCDVFHTKNAEKHVCEPIECSKRIGNENISFGMWKKRKRKKKRNE